MANLSNSTAETVLLAEDDILLRAPLAEYLRECGYRVIEAVSADEAKQALANRDLGVSSVLASLNLAGDGFGISHWAKQHRPELRVTVMGTPRRAVEIVIDLCGDGKPGANSQGLLRRVQQMIASRRPPPHVA